MVEKTNLISGEGLEPVSVIEIKNFLFEFLISLLIIFIAITEF